MLPGHVYLHYRTGRHKFRIFQLRHLGKYYIREFRGKKSSFRVGKRTMKLSGNIRYYAVLRGRATTEVNVNEVSLCEVCDMASKVDRVRCNVKTAKANLSLCLKKQHTRTRYMRRGKGWKRGWRYTSRHSYCRL
jgi:hypothetical protein